MAKYVKTEQGYKKFAAVTYDKMDKIDPTGTGSFSMNRKAGTVIGVNSHAEGNNTTASGDSSHAEGYHTTANGEGSHVQGKYNIEDTSNTYADIIGNGTSDTARSNAATVDWNGNAWFAGDVYTGSTSGTNKDDGSKKLATEEYVNSSIAATSVLYTAQSLTEEQQAQARANIGVPDLSTCVQTNKENILGDNGSIISNSSRGNSLTISNGVIEQKNSNQDTVSLGNAKVVFSHDNDGSSSTRGNGTFTMYGRKGEEYFKFNGTNGDVRVSGIAMPTLQNDAVNKSYVDSQIANIKIPTASATALGGVKIGAGLAIADDGTLFMNIASAAVGQIIKVKAVDESGKPTEWEAVDIPSAVTDEHINSLIDAKLRTFQAP